MRGARIRGSDIEYGGGQNAEANCIEIAPFHAVTAEGSTRWPEEDHAQSNDPPDDAEMSTIITGTRERKKWNSESVTQVKYRATYEIFSAKLNGR
jgi:hypothetical protein